MLIHSASQLLTLTEKPQRGNKLGQLGIIGDGAVLIRDEKIVKQGPARSCATRTRMKQLWMLKAVLLCLVLLIPIPM